MDRQRVNTKDITKDQSNKKHLTNSKYTVTTKNPKVNFRKKKWDFRSKLNTFWYILLTYQLENELEMTPVDF